MSERVKDAASRSLNGLRNLSGNTRHEVVAPHAEQVSGQSGLVEHRPRHDSHSTVRRYVLQAQSLLLGAWQSVRIQLRRNAQCQPKPLPVRRWTDDLYRWRPSSSLPNWKTVGKQLVSSFGSMLDLNWLRRDAPVWAVLFVILLFLFLQMGMHDSSKHVPVPSVNAAQASAVRSEEHTSELQSRGHLVCRLLLEKKKKKRKQKNSTTEKNTNNMLNTNNTT